MVFIQQRHDKPKLVIEGKPKTGVEVNHYGILKFKI